MLAEYDICFPLLRSRTATVSASTLMNKEGFLQVSFGLGWAGASATVFCTENFILNFESHCQLTDAEIISFFFLTSETSQS